MNMTFYMLNVVISHEPLIKFRGRANLHLTDLATAFDLVDRNTLPYMRRSNTWLSLIKVPYCKVFNNNKLVVIVGQYLVVNISKLTSHSGKSNLIFHT